MEGYCIRDGMGTRDGGGGIVLRTRDGGRGGRRRGNYNFKYQSCGIRNVVPLYSLLLHFIVFPM